METIGIYLYQIGFSVSLFILISVGLAIIFGMMRVINLAQGEFIMLGAYSCAIANGAGLPVWLAMATAVLVTAMFGVLVERIIIRFLYGRLLDTLLATWGLSLALVGLVTTVLGPESRSVQIDMGGVAIGGTQVPAYSLIIMAAAAIILTTLFAVWRFTHVGTIVRGTMQNSKMAAALGVDTRFVYMATFGFGTGLAGLAGALLVPLFGASPEMGGWYIAKAFITVMSGGPLPLLGTTAAASVFGTVDGIVAFAQSSVMGEISVLLLTIVLLRMLPGGITGGMSKGS